MLKIEQENDGLKGILPKDYAKESLNKIMLGQLIDLISGIAMGKTNNGSKDILGRVYEYFISQFAGSEGKRGGEFYTPRSIVQVLVEMLEPYEGRIYDPCCGSGGMFVQSEKFVKEHGGRINSISIYGQESNNTTWRLAKMNLAIRGIDADIKFNNDGSFHKDEHKTLKADFILANPQFNTSDWGGDRLNFVLTPGRYVGSMAKEEDNEPFAEKMTRLVATLKDQTNEANRLNSAIVANLKELGFEL